MLPADQDTLQHGVGVVDRSSLFSSSGLSFHPSMNQVEQPIVVLIVLIAVSLAKTQRGKGFPSMTSLLVAFLARNGAHSLDAMINQYTIISGKYQVRMG